MLWTRFGIQGEQTVPKPTRAIRQIVITRIPTGYKITLMSETATVMTINQTLPESVLVVVDEALRGLR